VASTAETPTVFIASSSEGLEVAEYLQVLLDNYCEVTVWNQGIFGLSESFLTSLLATARNFDYAILVIRADDTIIKRGKIGSVTRDNVLFELGLFMGALGPNRTFVVYSTSENPNIPTDLAGISFASYRNRSDGNLRAALGPASVQIREAIKKNEQLRDKPTAVITQHLDLAVEIRAVNSALSYVSDLISTFVLGSAGVAPRIEDSEAVERWIGNLLGMLQDTYAARQSDSYAVWLRPTNDKLPRLTATIYRNLSDAQRHYTFAANEGLAGKSWAMSTPAAHSHNRPHPWWVFREGCENTSYICAPVGPNSGSGGLVAVGSDKGFEIFESDLSIVSIFAALLSLVLEGDS
jgi:hypothetical protein